MTLVQMYESNISEKLLTTSRLYESICSGISKLKYFVLPSCISQEWKSLHRQANWEDLESKLLAHGHFSLC